MTTSIRFVSGSLWLLLFLLCAPCRHCRCHFGFAEHLLLLTHEIVAQDLPSSSALPSPSTSPSPSPRLGRCRCHRWRRVVAALLSSCLYYVFHLLRLSHSLSLSPSPLAPLSLFYLCSSSSSLCRWHLDLGASAAIYQENSWAHKQRQLVFIFIPILRLHSLPEVHCLAPRTLCCCMEWCGMESSD